MAQTVLEVSIKGSLPGLVKWNHADFLHHALHFKPQPKDVQVHPGKAFQLVLVFELSQSRSRLERKSEVAQCLEQHIKPIFKDDIDAYRITEQ